MAIDDLQHVQVQPLDLPLLVEPGLLGATRPITVDGQELVLHLPVRSNEEATKHVVQAPPVVGDRNVGPVLIDKTWGKVYSQGVDEQAEIHAFVMTAELAAAAVPDDFDPSVHRLAGDAIDRLVDETMVWSQRWLRWLEAMTSQSLHLYNPGAHTLSRRSANALTWVVADGTATIQQTSGTYVVALPESDLIDSERVLDEQSLEVACAGASAEDDPPLGLELRSRAHIASRRGDTRTAIAEVGTAAESWLTRALGLAADHGRTLGGLVMDAHSARLDIPSDTKSRLVDPRNDAVHRGSAPNISATRRALEIADELLLLADVAVHEVLVSMRRTSRPQRQDLVIFRRSDGD